MDIKERNEKILRFISEFGSKFAVQPEVVEALNDPKVPAWRRLIIPDMVMSFEMALRDNLPKMEETPENAHVPQ